MSNAAPNTKHVSVAHPVPREPEQYRATIHFGQRLRDRVPDQLRDRVVRETIERGECSGASAQAVDEEDVRQFFRFDRRIADRDWRVIVGTRDIAFLEPDEKHLAVTVMEVDDA